MFASIERLMQIARATWSSYRIMFVIEIFMCTYKTNIDHLYFELNQCNKPIIISFNIKNKTLISLNTTQNLWAAFLSELTTEGLLVKIAYGIYSKPRKSKFEVVLPSVDKVVQAIAIRDKAEVLPFGMTALNFF